MPWADITILCSDCGAVISPKGANIEDSDSATQISVSGWFVLERFLGNDASIAEFVAGLQGMLMSIPQCIIMEIPIQIVLWECC